MKTQFTRLSSGIVPGAKPFFSYAWFAIAFIRLVKHKLRSSQQVHVDS